MSTATMQTTTKLKRLLEERCLSNRDLQRLIFDKHGIILGDDRISKMVSGKLKNYQLRTAHLIADTLDVKIDDICEL